MAAEGGDNRAVRIGLIDGETPFWHRSRMASGEPILKILPEPLWREAEAAGRFAGMPVDLADGFIHFSTPAQVRETARRHFAGEADLLLASVDAAKLGPALRWEISRGGALFPHLYGVLPVEAVIAAEALPLGADGAHVFPEGTP